MALYSKVEYWNERYTKSRNLPPYEWYQNYHTLSHLLNPETLSGCSALPSSSSPPSAHEQYHTTTNHIGGSAGMTSLDDDDASASTMAMTNATAAKAYQCLHPNNCRVLILGCGNSTLGSNMYEAGWRGGNSTTTGSCSAHGNNNDESSSSSLGNNSGGPRFVQVDFSPVVIDQMKERYNDEYYQTLLGPNNNNKTPRMEFLCLDITQTPLPFENGSFDLIICKGVFDAILCSAGSVFNIRKLVKECLRLLNDDGGVLMVCTYGNPDNRVVFLEDEDGEIDTYWSGVSIHTLPSMARARKGSHNSNKNDYVYVCRKKRGAWKENMSVDIVLQQHVITSSSTGGGIPAPGEKKGGSGQGAENKPAIMAANSNGISTTTKESKSASASNHQAATNA